MPTPMRPWTRQLLMLVDIGITDREDLIRRAAPYVPIGHAHRTRERDRLRCGGPQARVHLTTAEIHAIGARTVLHRSLKKLVERGQLVRNGNHYHRPPKENP